MRSNSRSIEFTEIDLSEETTGVRIPPREMEDPGSSEDIPIIIERREHIFVEEAKRWVDEEGDGQPASFVPFMSYWPTYQQMSENQLQWYFYWRYQVRNDQYPDTDLSYIFLFIYEVINGVGWTQPEAGYELLDKIWIAYGDKYRQLNGYLKEWISDFVLVHSLNVPLINVLSRSNHSISFELSDMELLRLLKEQPARIPLDLLLTLSDYDMRRSKFYQEHGKSDLELYIPQVVAVVDAYLVKTHKLKLIDMFTLGQEQVTERYLFYRAVYDDTQYGRTTRISAVPIRSHVPLRDYISQIIRFTENKLRELRGVKGRLRGITLDQEIQTLIERYLQKEYYPKTSQQPVITIDTKKLALLQKDTEYVRGMLTIEEEAKEPVELNLDKAPLVTAEADKQMETNNTEDRPASITWDTTSLDEEWSLFASMLSRCQLEGLYALTRSLPDTELTRVADEYGTMPSLIIDDINNAAMETIGDLVIDDDRIAEEYLHCFNNLKG